MHSNKSGETLIQCDFDGTITEEDVSFILLDTLINPLFSQVKHEAGSALHALLREKALYLRFILGAMAGAYQR